MSILVANSKLALPGLVILAKCSLFDLIEDTDLTHKYVEQALRSLSRIQVDTASLKALVDELYADSLSDDTVAAVRKVIAALVKQLRADASANQNIIDLYGVVSGTFAGDLKHYVTLRDKVPVLGITEITELFPISVDTDSQLAHLEVASQFDAEQLAELRLQKDPQYKAIVQARKASRTVVSEYIKQYCRQSGKPLVSYAQLLADINAQNLQHSLPSGFEGYIDEFSQLYTRYGRKIAGFPSNAVVTMNPQYTKEDNCYVFTARTDAAVSTTYFYTQQYKNASRESKFTVVEQLSKSIKTIRSLWLKKLTLKDPQFEEAAILELIYHTQARIGSTSNATLDKRTGKYLRTYGMSTILIKHYTVEEDHVVFEYPGKAAFKGAIVHLQTHKFYPDTKQGKTVFEWLKKQKSKDEDAKLFSVSATRVRELLKDLGAPEGASVHKLRTLKGTLMMKDRIKTHPFKSKKTSATEVSRWLKEQALEVGIQLGHMSGEKYTASTAIAHYIDPVAMIRLFKEAGVAPPKTMLKLVGIDAYSLETIK